MNSKHKFLNVVDFKKDEPIPNWEFGYWYDTLKRWYNEDLPKNNPPIPLKYDQWISGEACPFQDAFYDSLNLYAIDVHDYFGFDERAHSVAVLTDPIPPFGEKIFYEDNENIIFRRSDGKKVKTKKDGRSMPQFIEYPVKTRKDFELIKKKFKPDSIGRFPKNWNMLVEEYKNRTYPLQLGGGIFCGFFSVLRELMGLEQSLYSLYDKPLLVFEIMEFFTDFYIELYSKVISIINIDYILIWEDIAFKNGSLISPDTFKKFILPYYKRFTYKMREMGVRNFFVDTDGNFEVLIKLFIEGGINGFYPFEIQAGIDIEKIRRAYTEIIIMGGVNKNSLMKGQKEIIKELVKVKRMLKKGGYIPYTDHMVPPEVSFSNYIFYRKELNKILKQ